MENADGTQKGYDAFVRHLDSTCREMNAESAAENLLAKNNSGFLANTKITDDITLLALECIGSV